MAFLKIGGMVVLLLANALGSAVAQPAANVTIVGRLTDGGAECQALRGDDGKLYTLTGDLAGTETGDRVRVKGRVAEMSFCMQGTTIEVRKIKQLK